MVVVKLVLTYNYQHGTQTISLEEIESALSSDFDGATPPKQKSHSVRNGFFVLPEMNGARTLRFDHKHFAGQRPEAALCAAGLLPIWQKEMRRGTEAAQPPEYRSDFAACKRRIFAKNAQKSKENPTGTEQAQLAEYPAYLPNSLPQ